MNKKEFIVTSNSKRPASDKDECFYCHQPIGDYHLSNCVLINQKMLVNHTLYDQDEQKLEFKNIEIAVPIAWWDYLLKESPQEEHYNYWLNFSCNPCPMHYIENMDCDGEYCCETEFIKLIGQPYLSE